ncbi:MAG: L-serine ammonia-lyase, iron-sulfur-dependent, subunit alpha [Planctomycetota bacterium]
MESMRELYRIGTGPSSSHSMAPRSVARDLAARTPDAAGYRATLYGSLAATGRGHLTDRAISEALAPRPVEIIWRADVVLPAHPNAMDLEALDSGGAVTATWRVYSIGGGAYLRDGEAAASPREVYEVSRIADILNLAGEEGSALPRFVFEREDAGFRDFLALVWRTMRDCIERGLAAGGVLPGGLGVPRKAARQLEGPKDAVAWLGWVGRASAYALACAEENASGGEVVTAPTCGSCGVMPAMLRLLQEECALDDDRVVDALACAGVFGNVVRTRASVAGSLVGCQGEVGTACAMAAAAGAFLLGGTGPQIKYAAEMGIEHNLGLTCDPVGGLVQIPCIERNAMAAVRAVHCALYALEGSGAHHVPFDTAVEVMYRTGLDLGSRYKETSTGGLAASYPASRP